MLLRKIVLLFKNLIIATFGICVPVSYRILEFISPNALDKVMNAFDNFIGSPRTEDHAGYFGTFEFVRHIFGIGITEALKDAVQGYPAPNPELIELKSGREVRLLDFMKTNRPLVVNFGSCTWPPFVAKLAKFQAIIRKYGQLCDFVIVYIEEIHPDERNHFKV